MPCSFNGAVLWLHPALQEEQLQGQHRSPERLKVPGSRQLGRHPLLPVEGLRQDEIWTVDDKARRYSRKGSPVIRPWPSSCWFIAKRIKSPGRCPKCAQREAQEKNGNSTTKHELQGTSVCRTELSYYCFFQRFTALSTYFHSHSFFPVLPHYSFISFDLTMSSVFFLYCMISVLQFLLLLWVAVPNGQLSLPVTHRDSSCCFLTKC